MNCVKSPSGWTSNRVGRIPNYEGRESGVGICDLEKAWILECLCAGIQSPNFFFVVSNYGTHSLTLTKRTQPIFLSTSADVKEYR